MRALTNQRKDRFMANPNLTAERLRQLVDYDPETGIFTWKIKRKKVVVGERAGRMMNSGYQAIGIEYGLYLAHRLAWLYVYGEWPKHNLDHINGNRLDNRIANLRDVPQVVNAQNRRRALGRSGLIGAFTAKAGRWRSQIRINGSQVPLGFFDTAEEAHQAYLTAKRRLHEGCTI
jgi:hypothetical protein